MSKKEIADLELWLHHETAAAYLVSELGERDKAVWLPKSQCEKYERKNGEVWEFSVPQWLAEEKGLV